MVGWLDIVWDVYLADSLKAVTKANGAKVNVIRCYVWHHDLGRTTRTRVVCLLCFKKKKKKKKGERTPK